MKLKVMYKCPKCNTVKMSAIAGEANKCGKCGDAMKQTKTMNK